jgi:8-oxo-dGTP pyrophosphatase MutT (NUDIX family)
VIVWLNGAHGAGMSAAASELLHLLPGSTLFDPGVVGDGLRAVLPPDRLGAGGDVRELASWRRLVADTAGALLAEVPGPLVTPMTLLRQEHRDEIFGALAARRIPVCHLLLHDGETILRDRSYQDALPWLRADAHTVDVAGLTPRQTAERIAGVLAGDAAPLDIVQTPEPTGETVAAGVLLFDEDDRVLLVDPTYKPGWEFPGGVVEPGEAPARAGIREVAEELGLELARVPRLLVVDWEPPEPPGFGGLRLLFDGGRLEAGRAADLLLPGAELRGWDFADEAGAERMLPPVRFRRLRWALRARARGAVLNLEAGSPVGG